MINYNRNGASPSMERLLDDADMKVYDDEF